jgi:ABC-type antimicrobial peptide transport system ATPase subunit
MNEHRRQILQMLSQGQITADEAEQLIAALEKEPEPGSTPKVKAKFIRVVVEDGPTKVNVRVPMQLLRAGVKLASLIPPQARIQVDSALREHGMQIDLSQLKPENLEELIDHLNDLTVDVDDKNSKVRVFSE